MGSAFLLCVAGCGSTGAGTSPPTATPTATASLAPSVAPAVGCPSAADVGAGLGLTPPAPTANVLPEGVLCNYQWGTQDVLITLIPGVTSSIFSTSETAVKTFQKQLTGLSSITFSSVSVVGDEAYSYSYPGAGGSTDDGILAVEGTDYAGVSCTGTKVPLTQIEAFVRQILAG
jgi:hypothetical protein